MRVAYILLTAGLALVGCGAAADTSAATPAPSATATTPAAPAPTVTRTVPAPTETKTVPVPVPSYVPVPVPSYVPVPVPSYVPVPVPSYVPVPVPWAPNPPYRTSSVWMWAPKVATPAGVTVHVHAGTSQYATNLAVVYDSAAIVCSVDRGDREHGLRRY